MSRALPRLLRIVTAVSVCELLLVSCAEGEINLFPGPRDGGPMDPGGGGAASASSGGMSTSASNGGGGPDACDPSCGCGLGQCGASCFDLKNDPSHCGEC